MPQTHETPVVDPGVAARDVTVAEIPIIDLGLQAGDAANAGAVEAIAGACAGAGFFYVRGHGVADAIIEGAFDAARRFFALADDDKRAIHISRSHPHQRGYTGLGEERLNRARTTDLKECFDCGVERAPDHPDVAAGKPFNSPNVWPDLAGFRDAVTAYHAAMMGLSRALVQAVARGLGLAPDHFADAMEDPVGNLRLIHYPPQSGAIGEAEIGAGAHTDYGFLTILAQDDAGGLQIERRPGEWIAAPPLEGCFVVNLGELLSHWTNGRYRARAHRVVNTSGRDRYSIPFFLDPNVDATVEVIPSCIEAGDAPRFPPVNAGDYLTRRFNETYEYRR